MKLLALGTSVYMSYPALCQQGYQHLVDVHAKGPEPDIDVPTEGSVPQREHFPSLGLVCSRGNMNQFF